MEENMKYFSDMEKYEIINVNDGDKYGFLESNDVVIDEDGYLKYLLLNNSSKNFGLFSKSSFIEVSWDFVKKIGSRTIILDADGKDLKKIR
ncbi:YlmC/YmxH family sporulation protein [Clostridium niameyense]|uniref:YlmC/YmxH family sporulation protein n=1 Tax=Clostridium niameyense TaxID=1622073 RepID=A0A6M0R770_9CLOT|nr:YlmC/YmxH family sporulation protein [Clostridium niameyense]NEZ46096.1 YlmC/YmxH family sporulation protein [Clostridium niameyense]